MNWNLKTLMAALVAVSLATTPALASTGGPGAVSQPLALGVDLGSPDVPDNVVRYGTGANPGVIVTVQSSEDLDALEQWANASENRSVVERYNATNAALVAATAADIKPPLTSPDAWLPGGGSSISGLGYVKSWAWDRQVQYAEPIQTLAPERDHQKPSGAFYATATTSGFGGYDAQLMAYSGDAPNVDLNQTANLVGARSVSASGQGVSVAVIDSGVNFGNGTLYGNGTAGSQMRVGDAYDYVDGESVNLSVSRGNLSAELSKMDDPNGHGSWVSSAVLNARSGIAPNATLMAYRTLNSDGQGSTSDIRAAIERANAQGADIIVMSLGSPVYSEGMADALKHALSEDGNVTGAFVAVGNSYTTTRYVSSPADVETVIGVAATNAVNASTAKKAYFANVGPDTGVDGSDGATRGVQPDTAAPGMSISAPVFTAPKTDGGRQTTRRLSGTSMAAPIAGGVGALLLDAEPRLEGRPTEFRDRLVNSGSHTPNIGTTHSLGGMVNATRAIQGYDSADAPNRDLPDKTKAWDAANRALSGDVGVKLATISEWIPRAM